MERSYLVVTADVIELNEDAAMPPKVMCFCFCVLFCLASHIFAVEPGEILPRDAQLDPQIPTPEDHLGFKIGHRHIYHHELVSYLKSLASASARVTIREYARSYGGRPLVVTFITSPKNHKKLEAIRQQHLQLGASRDDYE